MIRTSQQEPWDAEAEAADDEALQADYDLAQRCAAGEVAAWEELYGQHHDRLVACIRRLLAGHSDDLSLVDEIAARVWYALVQNDGKLLLSYDPHRGARLGTFMRAIAKDMLRRHYRSERRRQDRELVAFRDKPHHHDAEIDSNSSVWDEFMETLSPRDREFCSERLMNNGNGSCASAADYSAANIWQKTSRLCKQLRRFLQGGS